MANQCPSCPWPFGHFFGYGCLHFAESPKPRTGTHHCRTPQSNSWRSRRCHLRSWTLIISFAADTATGLLWFEFKLTINSELISSEMGIAMDRPYCPIVVILVLKFWCLIHWHRVWPDMLTKFCILLKAAAATESAPLWDWWVLWTIRASSSSFFL